MNNDGFYSREEIKALRDKFPKEWCDWCGKYKLDKMEVREFTAFGPIWYICNECTHLLDKAVQKIIMEKGFHQLNMACRTEKSIQKNPAIYFGNTEDNKKHIDKRRKQFKDGLAFRKSKGEL